MTIYEWILVIIYLIVSLYLMYHSNSTEDYEDSEDRVIGLLIFIIVLLRLAAYFNL